LGWVKRLRVHAGVCAVALFATACSISSSPVVGPGTPGATAPQPNATTPAPGGSAPAGPSTSGHGTPGQTNPGTVPSGSGYADDAGVGAMARTYLRRSPATSMVVEVDWVRGRSPSQSSLDHLASVLRRELDKPGGVTIERGNEIAAGKSQWSLADLGALEKTNRSRHSRSGRATMWFGFVDGTFAANENALAVAFSASATAIFRDRINAATSSLVLAPEIERSVLVHEAGHLLALVNIGYRSRFDHEDAQHPNHSNNPESVMYWAVEDISVRDLLRGGPPDDFDQADRADLALLRG
jgi:hypothetical protein